jgi:hypothetical protein
VLSNHPEVAFWGEPRPIWMHGNAYRDNHVLRAENLTLRIARYIDRRFGDFLEASDRVRFAEKTPSNCLRIGFIDALYPDAIFVNIIRDGLATVRSAVEIRKKKPNPGLLQTRFRETPLMDWPAYLPMFLRTVWRPILLRNAARYWGAAPPGWREWSDLPAHIAAARQWKALVSQSICEGRALPAERYLEFRFEDLIQEPEPVIRRMLEFCELSIDDELLATALQIVNPKLAREWASTLTPEQELECVREMNPLYSELGYTYSPQVAS